MCALLTGCAASDPATEAGTGATDDTIAAPTDVAGANDVPDDGIQTDSCAAQPDGTACDDQNPCTVDDQCGSGLCIGGANMVCDAQGACRPGSCDPTTGCVYDDAADGSPCSVACFSASVCTGGVCEPDEQAAIVCPKPTDPCVDQLHCDPATGLCDVPILAVPGTVCDSDADVCTLETCDAEGACIATGDLDNCSEQQANNPCWTWTCNKKSGCVQTLFVVGASCDDNNPCTASDTCGVTDLGQAACLGEPLKIDDDNPCTDDSCTLGVVEHKPLDGVVCDSDDPCSDAGLCQDSACIPDSPCECETDADCLDDDLCAGELLCDQSGETPKCVTTPGTAVVCEPTGFDCALNVCSPATGLCNLKPAPDGTPCDDGDACTPIDACASGQCTPGPPIGCDDGNPCTVDEFCAGGECKSGGQKDCDDGNPCTFDLCIPGIGCKPEAFAGLCDNGDKCTEGDLCIDGDCIAGDPVDCDDDEPCTLDGCESETGCTAKKLPGDCGDGDACTLNTVCQDGKCGGGTLLDCDDKKVCTTDSCDPDSGCQHALVVGGCEDGDACTAGDVCTGDACIPGPPLTCDDGEECTTDTCESDAGCVFTATDGACDGGLCVDGECVDLLCGADSPFEQADPPSPRGWDFAALNASHHYDAGIVLTKVFDYPEAVSNVFGAFRHSNGEFSAKSLNGHKVFRLSAEGVVLYKSDVPVVNAFNNVAEAADTLTATIAAGNTLGKLQPTGEITAFGDQTLHLTSLHQLPNGNIMTTATPPGGEPAVFELSAETGMIVQQLTLDAPEPQTLAVTPDGSFTSGYVPGSGWSAPLCGEFKKSIDVPWITTGLAGLPDGSIVAGAVFENRIDRYPPGLSGGPQLLAAVSFPRNPQLVNNGRVYVSAAYAMWVLDFPCKPNPQADGDACCDDGFSAGGSSCDDGDPCTLDNCGPEDVCIHTQTANALECDDGEACTKDDSCQAGGCAGTDYECDDGNTCTEDVCNGTGCGTEPVPKCCGNGLVESGEDCDDGNQVSGDECPATCQCPAGKIDCNGDGVCECDQNECFEGECLGCIAIQTCDDLQLINDDLAADYCLVADLDCGAVANFSPLGGFKGTLDGKGHVIANLAISTDGSAGLFGSLSGATITDLGFADVDIKGYNWVAALTSNASDSTVTGCWVTGNVSAFQAVGGLIGQNHNTKVEDCWTTANVTKEDNSGYAGGLVSWNSTGSLVRRCWSKATVTSPLYAGGLVGINWNGTVADSWSLANANGGSYAAALVGYTTNNPGNGTPGIIRNSWAGGKVTSSSASSGGITGRLRNDSIIVNSYSFATIVGAGSGLAGGVDDPAKISKSFWDVEASGTAKGSGGKGLTTAQMQQLSTYSGWDFVQVWKKVSDTSYPCLEWQADETCPTFVCGNGIKEPGEDCDDANDVDDDACTNACIAKLFNISGFSGSQFDVTAKGAIIVVGIAKDDPKKVVATCFNPDGSVAKPTYTLGTAEANVGHVGVARGAASGYSLVTWHTMVQGAPNYDWRNKIVFLNNACNKISGPKNPDPDLGGGIVRHADVRMADYAIGAIVYEHQTSNEYRLLHYDITGKLVKAQTFGQGVCGNGALTRVMDMNHKTGEVIVGCEASDPKHRFYQRYKLSLTPLDLEMVEVPTAASSSWHNYNIGMNDDGGFVMVAASGGKTQIATFFSNTGALLSNPTAGEGSPGPRILTMSTGDFLVSSNVAGAQLRRYAPDGTLLTTYPEPGNLRLDGKDIVYRLSGSQVVKAPFSLDLPEP